MRENQQPVLATAGPRAGSAFTPGRTVRGQGTPEIGPMTRRAGRSSHRRPAHCRDHPTGGRLRNNSPTSTPPTYPALLSQVWNKQIPDWSRIIPRQNVPARLPSLSYACKTPLPSTSTRSRRRDSSPERSARIASASKKSLVPKRNGGTAERGDTDRTTYCASGRCPHDTSPQKGRGRPGRASP
jgi:hypothetical protein